MISVKHDVLSLVENPPPPAKAEARDRVVTMLAAAAIALVIAGVVMVAVGASKGMFSSHTTLTSASPYQQIQINNTPMKGWLSGFPDDGQWHITWYNEWDPPVDLSHIFRDTSYTTHLGVLSNSGIVCISGAAVGTLGIGVGAFALGRHITKKNEESPALNIQQETIPQQISAKTQKRLMIAVAAVATLLVIAATLLIVKGATQGAVSTQTFSHQHNFWFLRDKNGWNWWAAPGSTTTTTTLTTFSSSISLPLCITGAAVGALGIGMGAFAGGMFSKLHSKQKQQGE